VDPDPFGNPNLDHNKFKFFGSKLVSTTNIFSKMLPVSGSGFKESGFEALVGRINDFVNLNC
jgi:hypothetical protein